MNVQPGDKLCPLSASVLLDDSDRGLRVVEVVHIVVESEKFRGSVKFI